MVKNLNDKNLLKNLLKAVKELTELLKTTDVRKNIGDTTISEKLTTTSFRSILVGRFKYL